MMAPRSRAAIAELVGEAPVSAAIMSLPLDNPRIPPHITARRVLRRRQPAGAAGSRGFTLLEVVAAFSILALGLGMAMQAASGAMQQSRQAAEHTRAALHAQSVMDTLGVGVRLEEGEQSGEFADGSTWHAVVTPYELTEEELPEGFDPQMVPVQLMRIELTIEWPRGEQTGSARFSTLRAMMPAPP